MICWRILCSLLVVLVQVFGTAARTNTDDFVALEALKDVWKNLPPSWDGDDPCGNDWDGISCSDDRVTSISLGSMNLNGQLSSDIQKLSALVILDLSYNNLNGALPTSIGNLKKLTTLILVGCGLSGRIPDSIGSLPELQLLSLNSNNFVGPIPPSIGNLSKLYLLDLTDNKLSGTIPVSKGSTPGLDMLVSAGHFHLGKNQLSGEIPPQLFSSKLTLIHLLLENNRLTGSIPSSLGLVQTLEVVRLDRNSLSGSVPENLSNLLRVQELFLANNYLTGPLPNLTGMTSLTHLDMSNNSFDATDFPPWFSSLQSLAALIMDDTHIQGQLPVSLFDIPCLQTVSLKNNQLNGTLNIGSDHSDELELIDLRNNSIEAITQRAGYSIEITLVGNPICNEGGTEKYCTIPQQQNYSTPPKSCTPLPCDLDKTSSPTCRCAYPYSGTLVFSAPSFASFGNTSVFGSLQQKLLSKFRSESQPVDSVSLSNPTRKEDGNLELNLQVFPSGQDYFNRTGISGLALILSKQTFTTPDGFGPYSFNANNYTYFTGSRNSGISSAHIGALVGALVGGLVLLLLSLVIGIYAFRQKKRAEIAGKKSDPFASWDPSRSGGRVPHVKGAICFSFDELKKCTDNFSGMNEIGHGGYGKVYRGTLPSGQLVAVKRAQHGSSQGGIEFATEIELLSRVHHKNLVSLLGFCFDQGEQMLVYEYIINGSLKDGLTGRTGIRLDWMRRLRIALGAARGIHYLHELADPPIIHRDIKTSNILLDERLNAKVADFGLSKPMGEQERSHVTTEVKGTAGYFDPEYYMTQQLTQKSDVYSFGVVLLELLTARRPIEKGKYIVNEVKQAMDKTKDMYNLEGILDPIVASNTVPGSVEKVTDLALKCIQEPGFNRPTMGEVLKEIENIMELAGLNPNAESTASSQSFDARKASSHPYTSESLSSHSGASPP
ncbi:probable leucine-rich repeat receptor-like protein kinase At5g49770 [Sesamum indicum]|uniref:non-specific serine/threonine protein kinase n=1 Tax=Sesamum indicum TaxID=4182 RepID=A0A6I9U3U0_SESIN|nr:probable leucine-rich repeat receptor-like protein kinase At5g49770 [Sesamum indicum]XP_020552758.1 probable leucine-rich repeat receptor-like protein kinase At5g49770 [Sesamum indicum]XP_020552759.1 probable leucine-rich repeat receptor-like protein kinase At5g49770 [Sesamum indicum]XP_020552760.1 probable leucine-rich repeat receptor-like protein kinase At5g49770 [Sesamum indicum]